MALVEYEPYCLRDLFAKDGVDTSTAGSDVAGSREDSANAYIENQSERMLDEFKTYSQRPLASRLLHGTEFTPDPAYRCAVSFTL